MPLISPTPIYGETLKYILSDEERCIELCQKFALDIVFVEMNGVWLTSTNMALPVSGRVKPLVSLYENYSEREFIKGAEFCVKGIRNRTDAESWAIALGVKQTEIFLRQWNLRRVLYGLTPLAVIGLLATSGYVFKTKGKLAELNEIGHGIKGRRKYYAFVDYLIRNEHAIPPSLYVSEYVVREISPGSKIKSSTPKIKPIETTTQHIKIEPFGITNSKVVPLSIDQVQLAMQTKIQQLIVARDELNRQIEKTTEDMKVLERFEDIKNEYGV